MYVYEKNTFSTLFLEFRRALEICFYDLVDWSLLIWDRNSVFATQVFRSVMVSFRTNYRSSGGGIWRSVGICDFHVFNWTQLYWWEDDGLRPGFWLVEWFFGGVMVNNIWLVIELCFCCPLSGSMRVWLWFEYILWFWRLIFLLILVLTSNIWVFTLVLAISFLINIGVNPQFDFDVVFVSLFYDVF